MHIYIAGPYTADTREGVAANVKKAEEVGKQVLLAGFVPIIPHRLSAHWEELPEFAHWEHGDWIENFCLRLIDRCDAILFMEGWEQSKGSVMERDYGEVVNKKMVFSLNELMRWYGINQDTERQAPEIHLDS